MAKDVFISYKTDDFDDANWVRSFLETNGISCWMAPASIPGGSNYAREIPKAIRGCRVFVLILSSKTQDSQWVPKEVDQAINAGKTVLPFMLENCPMRDDFNFYLSNVQRYAAYENKVRELERMLREIRALLDVHEEPETPTEPAAAAQAPVTEPPVEQPLPEEIPVEESPAEKIPVEETPAVTVPVEKAPEVTEPAPKEEKPTVKLPEQKPMKKAKGKKGLRVLAIVAAAVLLITGIAMSITMFNRITIAGEVFARNDYSVDLEEKTLTLQDVAKLKKFKALGSISLTDCTLPAGVNLHDMMSSAENSVKLNNCGITQTMLDGVDFSALSIVYLHLNDNKEIKDISGIGKLGEQLYNLEIDNTSVSDLTPLQQCIGLQQLNADGCQLTTLEPLSACTELEMLSVNNNKLTTLTPLSACKELQLLSVNNNQLTDLAGLEQALDLAQLYANHNRLKNIDGLTNATLLKRVDLSYNELQQVTLLNKSAETLLTLNLAHNRLENKGLPADCTAVTELWLDGNALGTLDGIKGMKQIEYFSARGCELTNIDPLKTGVPLTFVDVSENKLTALPKLPTDPESYVTLYATDNQLTVAELPDGRYSAIYLYGNPALKVQGVGNIKCNDMVLSYHGEHNYEQLAEVGWVTLLDCPGDQVKKLEGTLGYGAKFMTTQEFLNQN